jgi:hypothetical protein
VRHQPGAVSASLPKLRSRPNCNRNRNFIGFSRFKEK